MQLIFFKLASLQGSSFIYYYSVQLIYMTANGNSLLLTFYPLWPSASCTISLFLIVRILCASNDFNSIRFWSSLDFGLGSKCMTSLGLGWRHGMLPAISILSHLVAFELRSKWLEIVRKNKIENRRIQTRAAWSLWECSIH